MQCTTYRCSIFCFFWRSLVTWYSMLMTKFQSRGKFQGQVWSSPGIPEIRNKLKHASIVSPLDSKHVSTSPLLACPSTHPQFGIPLPHRPQMPRPARCCLWMLRVLSWLARGHFGPHLRIGLFCRHSSFHQVLSSHLPVLPIATDTNQ